MLITTKNTFESSWAELKQAVKNGTIREVLHSGDKIPVMLKNGEKAVVVATFDESGKLFFVFDNCLRDAYYMNPRFTNGGAWAGSKMREHMKKVFELLPDDLQAAIEPIHIIQANNGGIFESDDKLFLLSEMQVFGDCRYSQPEAGVTQLDIFKGERDRVKEREGIGTEWWWLRSPRSGSSTGFVFVYSFGSVSYYGANFSGGVAPSFCI